MSSSTITIIALAIAVVALAIVLLYNGRNKNKSIDEKSAERDGSVPAKQTGIILSDNTTISMDNVDELVLFNALGQALVLKRPNEISEMRYREIAVGGAGKAIQHAGQGAMPMVQQSYTLQQLKSQNPNGLFTATVPKDELHQYKKTGLFSSMKWTDGKVDSHHGFKEVTIESISGTSPVVIAGMAMQGMAIVSGQYYLKRITDNLNKLSANIEDLKNLHESEVRGTLMSCRDRLGQIAQMNYCSDVDLNEIRILANEARKILGQYTDRYNEAYKKVHDYYFDGWISGTAVETYNNMITEMRYLLQVCMIADRIIDEAYLTEFVTRRKINVNDPALEDIYRQMDHHYHEGFNAELCEKYDDRFGMLERKGERIIDAGIAGALYNDEAKHDMLVPVINNLQGLRNDVSTIPLSVRRASRDQEDTELLMMIDEKTGEVKMFEPA